MNGNPKFVNKDNLETALALLVKHDGSRFNLGAISDNINHQYYNVMRHELVSESFVQMHDNTNEFFDVGYVLENLSGGWLIDTKANAMWGESGNICEIGEYDDMPGAEEILTVYASIPDEAWDVWRNEPAAKETGYVKDLKKMFDAKLNEAVIAVHEAIEGDPDFKKLIEFEPSLKVGYEVLGKMYDKAMEEETMNKDANDHYFKMFAAGTKDGSLNVIYLKAEGGFDDEMDYTFGLEMEGKPVGKCTLSGTAIDMADGDLSHVHTVKFETHKGYNPSGTFDDKDMEAFLENFRMSDPEFAELVSDVNGNIILPVTNGVVTRGDIETGQWALKSVTVQVDHHAELEAKYASTMSEASDMTARAQDSEFDKGSVPTF